MPGSILEAHGPRAAEIAALWWTLLAIAAVGLGVVGVTLAAALLRQRRPPPLEDPRRLVQPSRFASLGANTLVVVLGLAVPAVILVITLVNDVRTLAALAAPPSQPRLTIEVTGHQFWWE